MIEKFVMNEHTIPDVILHDQDLYNVSYNDKVLTLSFETHFYPQDYTDTTFAEKYKDLTKCHIKCKLEDESFCDVHLETSLDKNNNYKGKIISVEEFTEIANKEIKKRNEKNYWPWEYCDINVSPNIRSLAIELHIWLKYKRVVYTNCILVLNTNEIEFIWE